jgi:release factor glutamine methyltransferase
MSRPEMTVGAALDAAVLELRSLGPEARREAELLLCAALGVPRSFVLANLERLLSGSQLERLLGNVQRRAAGEPFAYVAGRKEFWSLELEVDDRVLVPRAETEVLVEFALGVLPAGSHPRVLDLGTGSGAIALAIAHERPQARIVATDVSADALAVACRNAERLGLGNVSFEVGDWFAPVGAMHFDLIVSNPPYVADDDPRLGNDGLRAEPRIALTAGVSGLEAITQITARAREHLRPDAWLAVEHAPEQAEAAAALFSRHGFSNIRSLCDLTGAPRVTAGRYASSRSPSAQ